MSTLQQDIHNPINRFKFRVYNKTDRALTQPHAISEELLHDDNLVVMQWTGLLDKAGKEIYEGDIVKCLFATGREDCEIVEDKGCYWVDQKRMTFIRDMAHDNLYWHNEDCEVVGNIYENPELLNQ